MKVTRLQKKKKGERDKIIILYKSLGRKERRNKIIEIKEIKERRENNPFR